MDIIPIAPTPQPEQSVQNTSSPGTDDTGFNTALNKAISSNDKGSDTNSDASSFSAYQNKSPKEENPAETLLVEADINNQNLVENQLHSAQELTVESDYNAVYVTTVSLNALLELPEGSQQSSQPSTSQQLTTLTDEIVPANIQKPAISVQIAPLQSPEQTKPAVSPYLSVTLQGQTELQITGNGVSQDQNSLLLAEINKLVTQNNDKVAITANFTGTKSNPETIGYMNSPVLTNITNDSANITVTGTGASVAVPDIAPQLKSETQQAPLRKDSNEQLLSARIASIKTKDEPASGDKDGLQQNNNSGQQTTAQQNTTVTGTGSNVSNVDIPNGSQFFSSHFENAAATDQSKSVTTTQSQTPSYLQLVQEKEVLNQIVNRFSLHTRIQSGKMTLQLHPAELGELKIDVEMKGDSLKANIFAQTQQAQEIIEKNLPKLRSILQDQGMTVDDLIVTFQSETVDDFTQQQDNLFQNQMAEFKQSLKNENPVTFEQSIEETLFEVESEQQTGVNLTV